MPEERKYSRAEVLEILGADRLRGEVTETLQQPPESWHKSPVHLYESIARLRQAYDKYPEFFGDLKIRQEDVGAHLEDLIETEQWREEAVIDSGEKPAEEGSDDDIPF